MPSPELLLTGVASLNDFGHQGLFHDRESGLVYNRARYVNTRLGRFMGPDTLNQNEVGGGYQDGMSFYEYLGSAPATYVDPSGMTVVITCKARKRIKSGLGSPVARVTGYDLKRGDKDDEYSGTNTKLKMDASYSEIAGSMIKSKRVFKIKGDTAADAEKSWLKHIDARKRTMAAAKTKRFGFKTGKIDVNPVLWRQEPVYRPLLSPADIVADPVGYRTYARDRNNVFGAIADIWKAKGGTYSMACQAGTGIVMLRGISLAMGKAEFNKVAPTGPFASSALADLIREDLGVPKGDWIPGDWGYVKNDGYVSGPGFEGENIIYMGKKKGYWGHLQKVPLYKPLTGPGSWYEKVKGWGGPGGKASISGTRKYPKLGLRRRR